MLRAVLPTDADFSAFCVDFFPAAAERFSSGMDRVAKATLLIELADTQAIIAALAEYAPGRLAEYEDHRTPSATTQRNPYRGLSAFQLDEAHLFFGRETLTGQLWQRFEGMIEKAHATRLLAIVGPSGSGKSSVARAGLLAALVRSPVPGPRPMRFVIIKPGERPIESMARALVPLLPIDRDDLLAQRAISIEELLRNRNAPSEGLRRFAADLPELVERPLLVFVDQFEEIYTLCGDEAERDLFVGTLLHAARAHAGHVSVVLTLRSDFLGETQRHHNQLNRLIAQQGVIVPALSPKELRDAIVRPAQRAGRLIDEATVELLLAEARGSQGALPLVEFALTRIWEGMERGEEPGATLRKVGGVGGALAGEAQKIYRALSQPEQATARRALVRLVQLGEGTRDTRRRSPLSKLCGRDETEAAVLSVLRQFSTENARLVTLDGKDAETIAEVTHEALFEHWAELHTWIEQNRTERGLHDRALEAATLWSGDGQPAGRLWRPPDLELLRDYQRRKPEEFSPLLATFLATAELRHWKERKARALSLVTLIAMVATFFVGGAGYVVKERQRAQAERQRLMEAKARLSAERTVSETRVSLALKQPGNRLDAVILGLGIIAEAEAHGDLPPPRLLSALMASAGEFVMSTPLVHPSPVLSGVYSPDGNWVVTGCTDGNVYIWEASSQNLFRRISVSDAPVRSLSVRPLRRNPLGEDRERFIAAGTEDGTIAYFEAQSSQRIYSLTGHTAAVRSLSYSEDGRYLFSGSTDRTVRIFDLTLGRTLHTLSGHTDAVVLVHSMRTPLVTGEQLITADAGGTVHIWDISTGRHHQRLNVSKFSSSIVSGAMVSSIDTFTAIESRSALRRIDTYSYKIAGKESNNIYNYSGHTFDHPNRSPITRIALLNEAVLSGHEDGSSQILYAPFSSKQLRTESVVLTLEKHAGAVTGVAFPPFNRDQILTTSEDGRARLWQLKQRGVSYIPGSSESILINLPVGEFYDVLRSKSTNARFSENGQQVIFSYSINKKTSVGVMQISDGRRVQLGSMGDPAVSIALSSTGRVAATIRATGPYYDSNVAELREIPSGQTIRTAAWLHAGPVSLALSPDGQRVAIMVRSRRRSSWVSIELVRPGTRLYELDVMGQDQRLVFSPDGRQLATAGETNATIWDTATGKKVADTQRLSTDSNTSAVAFSNDGSQIAIGSEDRVIRLYSSQHGRLLQSLSGLEDRPVDIRFTRDGRQVVTIGQEGVVHTWDTANGRKLGEFHPPGVAARPLALAPDGERVLVVSDDLPPSLHIATPDTFFHFACQMLSSFPDRYVTVSDFCQRYRTQP